MLKYCLLNLAAVISGINATIYRLRHISEDNYFILNFFLSKIEPIVAPFVLFGMYCSNKLLNMFIEHIKSNVQSFMTHK